MTNTEKLANLNNKSNGTARLGLPAYAWWSEALHGVASSPGVSFGGTLGAATQFPQAMTMRAGFDDDLIEQVGNVIGTEARAFANNGRAGLDFWTPNINPFRDPRWGRGPETPGEDAFAVSNYASAYIRGMQGTDPTHPLAIATCKHFAGYDLEAWESTDRFKFDAKISTQDLAEYYLPSFQACARDSKVGSIMCSYNSVNGVPSCANTYLMTTILRQHWGWSDLNQYIVSDCDAVYFVWNGHQYAPNAVQAVGQSITAGTDNICYYNDIPDVTSAFNQGFISQQSLDRSLTRQFQALVMAGYFDGPNGRYRNLGPSNVNTAASQALALKVAEEGTVLLKNDGFLPAKLSATTVAMVGFWANNGGKMLGGYSGTPPYTHSPVYAAQQMGLTVNSATGPLNETTTVTDTWTSAALAAAQNAQTIIYFGGIDNTIEKESLDRYTIAWPSAQLALIQRLAALGKPVVVVKLGSHVDDTPLLNLANVRAVVWAGYPGQDGGTAVMRILTGATSPAGRLSTTMYPSAYVNQVIMTDMGLRPNGTNPGRTYRWYNKAVFPFGHGLHYTTFNLTTGCFPPTVSIQSLVGSCPLNVEFIDKCPFVPLPVTVTNSGQRASDFVALAFASGQYGPTPYPIKTLVSYRRFSNVAAGQSQTASLNITLGELARRDADGNLVLYPGSYTLQLDQPTSKNVTFTLTGTQVVLDNWPQQGDADGNPPSTRTAVPTTTTPYCQAPSLS